MRPRQTGGCLCGAVRYRVAGPLRDVVACHCAQCRRSSGHFAAATAARYEVFNPQQQPKVVYPSNVVVARAYLDQLNRSKTIAPERAAAVKTALDRKQRNESLAAQLEQDAAAASSPQDAARLRGLAAAVKTGGR